MTKKVNGTQSVTVNINPEDRWEQGIWMFCQNGYQSTGVDISVEQFDMVKELVNTPSVVEFYEKLRGAKTP